MTAPLPLPLEAAPDPPVTPDPPAVPADPIDLAPQAPDWWAARLLDAIVAADASEDGEPILAAAGNAATAALLLLQHRAAGDGDPARSPAQLREVYAICADQTAIVRELLRELATLQAAPATIPAAPRVTQPVPPSRRRRWRRRRLRLVSSSR
jgi:hypothetical protein